MRDDKILVIKLGALGDFIQALGPMAAIRKHHKKAHITLITTKPFAGFARDCGYFDDIIIDTRPKFLDIRGWLSLHKTLNDGAFTRVYDLQNNNRTQIYFKLLKPRPEWVGIAKGASHRNTSPDRTAGHAYDGHVQTLGLAGITDIQIDTLDWLQGDIDAIALQKPYVLLVPGCAPDRPEKRWPAAHYGRLATMLTRDGYQPVLIGTKDDATATAEIAQSCENALDLTGQTSLAQIVSLAKGAAGAIGNDTGPMHLIGPTDCPSLVLFSNASNPVKHSPRGNNIDVLQRDDLENLQPEEALTAFGPR